MRKIIELKGIVDSVPDQMSQDGMCKQLVNLRPTQGGGWTLAAQVSAGISVAGNSKVFIHRRGGYENFIGYNKNTGAVTRFDKNNGQILQTIAYIPTNLLEIKFTNVNNFLVFTYIHDGRSHTKRALFNESSYTYFERALPDLPTITFGNTDKIIKTEHLAFQVNEPLTFPEDSQLVEDSVTAAVAQLMDEKSKEGYFEGYALVRYGFRLFDDTYAKLSAPAIVRCGKGEDFKVRVKYFKDNNWFEDLTGLDMGSVTKTAVYVKNVSAGKLNYTVRIPNETEIGKYKELIKSVDIFITKPYSAYSAEEVVNSADTGGVVYASRGRERDRRGGVSAVIPPDRADSAVANSHNRGSSSSGARPRLSGAVSGTTGTPTTPSIGQETDETTGEITAGVSYKENHLTSDKIIANCGNFHKILSIPIENLTSETKDIVFDPRNVSTLEYVPDDDFSFHEINGAICESYNSRLILGDCSVELFKGFSPTHFSGSYGSGYIYTEIQTEYGVRIVKSPTGDISKLGKIISYPDFRAKTMTVSDGTKCVTYRLKPHPIHNFSYFAFEDLKDIEPPVSSGVTDSGKTLSNIYADESRMQLSEFQNVLSFPAVLSYRVGFGKIKSIVSNSYALHGANFGDFPLYIMTTKGIWTAQVGIENVIESIKYLSEEVMENNSAVSVKGAVAFISSNSVIVMAGKEKNRIGDLLQTTTLNRLNSNPDYLFFMGNSELGNVMDYIGSVHYTSYLANAIIGYNYMFDELMVSNASYPYSFVYSFVNNTWFKMSNSFTYFIDDYPNLYAEKGGYVYELSKFTGIEDERPAVIVTRPIELEKGKLTRISKIHLDCYINSKSALSPSNPQVYKALYLYGSNNLYNWKLVNLTQTKHDYVNGLYLGTSNSTFRYWTIVAVVNTTNFAYSKIGNIEVEYEANSDMDS